MTLWLVKEFESAIWGVERIYKAQKRGHPARRVLSYSSSAALGLLRQAHQTLHGHSVGTNCKSKCTKRLASDVAELQTLWAQESLPTRLHSGYLR